MNSFYVYILAYPDGKVFYVGKGTGKRIDCHEYEAKSGGTSEKCVIIRDIWTQGRQVLKKKLYRNLSEEDALAIESILIHLFDRANLANEQDGQKRNLPRAKFSKPAKRKIVGFKRHAYQKDGLFFEDCEPIYEEVEPEEVFEQ